MNRRDLLQGALAAAVYPWVAAHLEAMPAHQAERLDAGRVELERLYQLFAGGKTQLSLLSDELTAFQITYCGGKDKDSIRLWATAERLLRDIGEPGEDITAFCEADRRCEHLVDLWAGRPLRNYLRLVEALLARATLYRVTFDPNIPVRRGYAYKAEQLLQAADDFLVSKCRKADHEVIAHLQLQLTGSDLRLMTDVTGEMDENITQKLTL